jgi:anion-transporting  ArsA/GET3 family ATPase
MVADTSAPVPVAEREAVLAVDQLIRTREVLFLTGKGGVGKSSLAAALALRAKALGLEPILLECDAPERPSPFPGGKRAGRELREVADGIRAVNVEGDDAIRQYLVAALPAGRLAEMVVENRVAKLFLRASPSVHEVSLIARIMQLALEQRGGPVIVDLHSTGHALHVLQAPDGIMNVVRAGPVYNRAKSVRDFVLDPDKCVLLPVALPEELPVTELLEFVDKLMALNIPVGPVFVNGVFDDPAPGVDPAQVELLREKMPEAKRAADDLRALRGWSERAERERHRLIEQLDLRGVDSPVITLPYVFELEDGETLASSIAAELERVTS